VSLADFKSKYDENNFSYALLSKSTDETVAEKLFENKYKIELEHNLDAYFHPASLLKLFIGFICEDKLKAYEDSELSKYSENTLDELKRAIRASIKESDNDALAYLIDFLAMQPYDYNLIQDEFLLKKLISERIKINEFFKIKGFSKDINIANKCFSFDYYGKEKQIIESLGANQISNRDLIKLLIKIQLESPLVLGSMYRLIRTEAREDIADQENTQNISSSIIDTNQYQVEAFSPRVLANNLGVNELYSKAGWNSRVRHDSVIFKFKNKDFILSILSKNLSYDEGIIQKLVLEISQFLR